MYFRILNSSLTYIRKEHVAIQNASLDGWTDGWMNEWVNKRGKSKTSGHDDTDRPYKARGHQLPSQGLWATKALENTLFYCPYLPPGVAPLLLPFTGGPNSLFFSSLCSGICDFTVSMVFLMKGKWCPMWLEKKRTNNNKIICSFFLSCSQGEYVTCLLSILLIMTWCTEALPNVCSIHYTHVLNVMRYEFGGRADESCPGANLELEHLFLWDD